MNDDSIISSWEKDFYSKTCNDFIWELQIIARSLCSKIQILREDFLYSKENPQSLLLLKEDLEKVLVEIDKFLEG